MKVFLYPVTENVPIGGSTYLNRYETRETMKAAIADERAIPWNEKGQSMYVLIKRVSEEECILGLQKDTMESPIIWQASKSSGKSDKDCTEDDAQRMILQRLAVKSRKSSDAPVPVFPPVEYANFYVNNAAGSIRHDSVHVKFIDIDTHVDARNGYISVERSEVRETQSVSGERDSRKYAIIVLASGNQEVWIYDITDITLDKKTGRWRNYRQVYVKRDGTMDSDLEAMSMIPDHVWILAGYANSSGSASASSEPVASSEPMPSEGFSRY